MSNSTMASASVSAEDDLDLWEMVLTNIGHPADYLYFSREAVAIPATTGSISALSSMLIISIIFRSLRKLSSPYHCIMLFMSVWDIATSIAIALTTLPMPADVHTVYPFETNAYGTAGTCAAQGFIILLGQMCTMGSNVALCVYHACTLGFGMSEETAKKCLLPFALCLLSIVCVPSASIALSMNLINPRPYEPYCYLGSYPETCNMNEYEYDNENSKALPFNIDCIGKEVSYATEMKVKMTLLLFVGAAFFSIIISLLLVLISMVRAGRRASRDDGGEGQGQPNPNDHHQEERENNTTQHAEETKTVLLLALMYILAFLFTWSWTFLSVVMGPLLNHELKSVQIFWHIVDYMKLICSPLQGFFNALIFIYDKIYYIRRADHDHKLTFFAALKIVILAPSQVPDVFVSSIELLQQDDERRREAMRVEEMVQADFAQESTISPASIPSNFLSIDTPSFQLSNDMSMQGIDSELEREMEQEGGGDPSNHRKYYDVFDESIPAEMRSWITPGANANTSAQRQTRANMNVTHPSSEKPPPSVDNNVSPASSPRQRQKADESPDRLSLGSGVSMGGINSPGSTSRRSIFSFGSLLSGFTNELGMIEESEESPDDNSMTEKKVISDISGHEDA